MSKSGKEIASNAASTGAGGVYGMAAAEACFALVPPPYSVPICGAIGLAVGSMASDMVKPATDMLIGNKSADEARRQKK